MNKYNFDKNKWMLYHYDILKRLADELRVTYAENFKYILLYGSYARGDAV